MNRNLFESNTGNEPSMRINRLVSVILNGVVVSKLASRNGNDVNAMAESLMGNLPHTVQHNIRSHEMAQISHHLRAEISQRMHA